MVSVLYLLVAAGFCVNLGLALRRCRRPEVPPVDFGSRMFVSALFLAFAIGGLEIAGITRFSHWMHRPTVCRSISGIIIALSSAAHVAVAWLCRRLPRSRQASRPFDGCKLPDKEVYLPESGDESSRTLITGGEQFKIIRTTLGNRLLAGGALVLVSMALVVAFCSIFTPVPFLPGWGVPRSGAIFLIVYVVFGLIAILWSLRRLTEHVVLKQDAIAHSVLGKKTAMRYDEITGITERALLFKATSSPERLIVLEDTHGRRLSFSSYLADYQHVVKLLTSRIGNRGAHRCRRTTSEKIALWIAVGVFVLCMAALVFAIWVNQ